MPKTRARLSSTGRAGGPSPKLLAELSCAALSPLDWPSGLGVHVLHRFVQTTWVLDPPPRWHRQLGLAHADLARSLAQLSTSAPIVNGETARQIHKHRHSTSHDALQVVRANEATGSAVQASVPALKKNTLDTRGDGGRVEHGHLLNGGMAAELRILVLLSSFVLWVVRVFVGSKPLKLTQWVSVCTATGYL